MSEEPAIMGSYVFAILCLARRVEEVASLDSSVASAYHDHTHVLQVIAEQYIGFLLVEPIPSTSHLALVVDSLPFSLLLALAFSLTLHLLIRLVQFVKEDRFPRRHRQTRTASKKIVAPALNMY